MLIKAEKKDFICIGLPSGVFPRGRWEVFARQTREKLYEDGDLTIVLKVGKRKKLIKGRARLNWQHPRDSKPYALSFDFEPNKPERFILFLNK